MSIEERFLNCFTRTIFKAQAIKDCCLDAQYNSLPRKMEEMREKWSVETIRMRFSLTDSPSRRAALSWAKGESRLFIAVLELDSRARPARLWYRILILARHRRHRRRPTRFYCVPELSADRRTRVVCAQIFAPSSLPDLHSPSCVHYIDTDRWLLLLPSGE